MDLTTILILGGGFLLLASDAGKKVLGMLFPSGTTPGFDVPGDQVPSRPRWRAVSADYSGIITPGGPLHAKLTFAHLGPGGTYRFGVDIAPANALNLFGSHNQPVQSLETEVAVGDDAEYTDYSATIDAANSDLTGLTLIPGLLVVNVFDVRAYVRDSAGHQYADQWTPSALHMV